MNVRYRITVKGRVQRVSFRASTRRRAEPLNVTGSATNLPDGSVEVIARGQERDVRTLLDWLHHGPSLARVDSVIWTEEPVSDSSTNDGFTVQ